MNRLLTLFAVALSAACSDSGTASGTSGPQTTSGATGDSTASSSVGGSASMATTVASTTDATSSATTSSSLGGSTSGDVTSGSMGGSTSNDSTVSSGGATTTGGGVGGSMGGASSSTGGGGGGTQGPSVLVFSRTTGYRHLSIETGIQALEGLAAERGWSLSASEDPALFTEQGLSAFNVLVFLSNSGDLLDDTQQVAMENFIRAGNGYVGIHGASTAERDWPWYGALMGAYFNAHPDIQQASIVVEDTAHPATAHLSETWVRTDEWYGFETNPRADVNVLLSLDEQSYTPGDGTMNGDHPIAWYHEYDGGRAFYTALGHTDESYAEPEFLQHLAGAIEWASGL
jgi:type 1 glutamine amidotransferase